MALALKDRLAWQAAGETTIAFDPTGRDETRLVAAPLSLIDPDPNQPRTNLGALAELAQSIRDCRGSPTRLSSRPWTVAPTG